MIHLPPARHPFNPVKVLLVSGLSDPTTCALTDPQRRFLAAVGVPEEWKVYWNFPYLPSDRRRQTPPLWLASVRNGRQFLAASTAGYRAAATRHWRAAADSAARLLVVTNSCGLEIVNRCCEPDDAGRVSVLALGPVASGPPRLPTTLVQGTADYVSRLFVRRPHVRLPGLGHMEYVQHPRVLQLANEGVSRVAAL